MTAQERFAGEPIPQTGQETWRRMYAYARRFAAEGGIRGADQPFQPGDPCPQCQRPLDEQTTARLRRFDEFVQGAAAADAATATAVLAAAP